MVHYKKNACGLANLRINFLPKIVRNKKEKHLYEGVGVWCGVDGGVWGMLNTVKFLLVKLVKKRDIS